eukprot:gene7794-8640_t
MENEKATKDAGKSEIMEKLNSDFEEHLKNVMEKNKDYKYDSGMTAENVEEECRKIPAFMNEAPTQEEIDASPALSALQALKYEETDPDEGAQALKEDGNYHFKHKEYKKAVIAYSEGLKLKMTDLDLKVILFTNRAAANFHLENNRSSLNDAKEALKLNNKHLKALIRAAMCCFELKLFDDCINVIFSLFFLNLFYADNAEQRLKNLRTKASHEKKKQDRDRRKIDRTNKTVYEKQKRLVNAIKHRGVSIEKPEKFEDEIEHSELEVYYWLKSAASHQPQFEKVYLDDKNELHWPVYFLYPEYNQSDFIEDFHENHRFADHLIVMFEPGSLPDWDETRSYSWKNLEIYFEDKHRDMLVKVNSSRTLQDVLGDKRYRVYNGAPTFLLLSKVSKFFTEFSKSVSVEGF